MPKVGKGQGSGMARLADMAKTVGGKGGKKGGKKGNCKKSGQAKTCK